VQLEDTRPRGADDLGVLPPIDDEVCIDAVSRVPPSRLPDEPELITKMPAKLEI
jgi:hypothetical protein